MKLLFITLSFFAWIASFAQTNDRPFTISQEALTNGQKKEIKTAARSKRPFYEDEKYIVSRMCRGEFGGEVMFKSKSSGITYSAGATCPVSVHQLNGKYYVTTSLAHMSGSSRLLEIADPESMEIKQDKSIVTTATTGTVTLVEKFGVLTLCSFTFNGELFHIVSVVDNWRGNESGTYVARASDNEFIYLQRITTEDIFTYDNEIVKTADGHLMVPIKDGYLDVFENRVVILKSK